MAPDMLRVEDGQAFSFTNTLQAVDVGYATNLHLQNFTIEGWIRRYSSSNISSDPSYLQNGTIFGYGSGGYAFILKQNHLGLTKVFANDMEGSATITDTNFHHVAVTSSNGTVKFLSTEPMAARSPTLRLYLHLSCQHWGGRRGTTSLLRRRD